MGTNFSLLFSDMLDVIQNESGFVNTCLSFLTQYPQG
jgi:hypothetical protein